MSVSFNFLLKYVHIITCNKVRSSLVAHVWAHYDTLQSSSMDVSISMISCELLMIGTGLILTFDIREWLKDGFSHFWNCLEGVMVNVLAAGALIHEFEHQSSQSKDCRIGIWSFSAKHAALWNKSKHWLDCSQDNVSVWIDMSTHKLVLVS